MDSKTLLTRLAARDPRAIGKAITHVENNTPATRDILAGLDQQRIDKAVVLGITGPPGAGKSTLTSELLAYLRSQGHRLGVIAIDPSSPLSGGALLGDRIRMMRHALDPDIIVRSMASRGRLGGLCAAAGATVRIMASSGCDYIIIETVGVGQSEMDIVHLADVTLMVLAPGFGDDIQAMKAGLLEVADLIVVNKSDQPAADGLTMEMEKLFQERGLASSTRVVQTIAATGDGIDRLMEATTAYTALLDDTGERRQRRTRALQRETLDWALEMLRPELLTAIQATPPTNDPRLRAEGLVARARHALATEHEPQPKK